MKFGVNPPGVERSPQGLFAYLWLRVEESKYRARAKRPDEAIKAAAQAALACDDAEECFDGLAALIPTEDSDALEPFVSIGRILWTMDWIDTEFYKIHPRAVVLSASLASGFSLPSWLENLVDARIINGVYHDTGSHRVIPHGPLRRKSRDQEDIHAEGLAERFSSLAVVPSFLRLRERPITLSHRVVGFSSVRGVTPGNGPHREIAAFIPIAEDEGDLVLTPKHEESQGFIDFQMHPSINAAERLVAALKVSGDLDIAIASELVMREDHADEIPTRLAAEPDINCRLIVAGSGQTRGTDYGSPWNEAQIFNGLGTPLWRQRKIWPARIDQPTAARYLVSEPGPSPHLEEATASGDQIEVVDIDSFGRCVVLICQDFEATPLTPELIRHLQPDWIFVPILDNGIDIGRWVHQRAFALSGESSARFLISCSTTLAALSKKSGVIYCGLAIGARDRSDDQEGRLACACEVSPGKSPGHAVLNWATAPWKKTLLSTSELNPVNP